MITSIDQLPRNEQELSITQVAENRNLFDVWTDDPYWVKRFDKVVIPIKVSIIGAKSYIVTFQELYNILSKEKSKHGETKQQQQQESAARGGIKNGNKS